MHQKSESQTCDLLSQLQTLIIVHSFILITNILIYYLVYL